jgi:translation elongation factor EF-Tu-like GTPase
MSKIEEYKAKQAELAAIKAVGRIDLEQVEYVEGGEQNQIIVQNASPLAVSAMLRFIYKNGEEFLGRMLAEAEAEVAEAEQAAIEEANQFIAERQ